MKAEGLAETIDLAWETLELFKDTGDLYEMAKQNFGSLVIASAVSQVNEDLDQRMVEIREVLEELVRS